jgi:hypothetical protein
MPDLESGFDEDEDVPLLESGDNGAVPQPARVNLSLKVLHKDTDRRSKS